MAIMLARTYAAFKAAGVGDSEAQAAAEEIGDYANRRKAIDKRLATMDGRFIAIDARFAAIDSKLAALIWAVGINAAATIAILGVLLRH